MTIDDENRQTLIDIVEPASFKDRFLDMNRSPVARYIMISRSPVYSLIFALPLLILYEAVALVFRDELDNIRNGADALLKHLLSLLGLTGTIHLSLVLVLVILITLLMHRKELAQPLHGRYFLFMFVESAVYAAGLGIVVSRIVQAVMLNTPTLGFGAQIILSLGAGIYEEFVFRVILISGLFLILHRLLHIRVVTAYLISGLFAALIFSGFHYIGALGDPFTIPSFLFRFVAGLALSGLYIARGYGVTAYTHTLYDLLVTFRAV